MTRTADPAALRMVRLSTPRTARCVVRGPEDLAAVRELWVVLHGYAQLAAEVADGVGALDDGTRLIIAPEGLSRFYDAPAFSSHRDARVGASWMTREDRLEEIADYLGWLQRAYEHFASSLGREVPLTVLGFSQGGSAAARWVASGRVPAARLIIWGSTLAPELDLGPSTPLRRVRTLFVLGNRDRFIKPEHVTAERARLGAAGFPHEVRTFDGGHRLDDDTLRQVAAESP
jgi:predicted esterase